MKHRYALIAGINLCCLIVILIGRRQLQEARAFLHTGAQPVLIEAVHFDGYSYLDKDEAVALRNLSNQSIDISSWRLTDGTSSQSVIPGGTRLSPYSLAWLTGDAIAFKQQFGFIPDVVFTSWPGFANSGDEVLLYDSQGNLVDALVYGSGDTTVMGWSGLALQPYTVRGVFAREGQIFFRKLDQHSGLPVPDTDQAADWAQEGDDFFQGRRVRYPGWDLEIFLFPARMEQPATLTIAVASDNAFKTVVDMIDSAQTSIQIASLTFENHAIGDALIETARRGVQIRLLLEGSPVGGIDDQEKAICQRLESVGAECWFMISDAAAHIYDRYRYLHAKYMVIDNKLAIIGSENLSPNSMPDDDKSDGTWGRRGVILLTDATKIVDTLAVLFSHDLDPANHSDVLRWQVNHPIYGAPSPGYVPIRNSGGISYTVRYPDAPVFLDAGMFELQQAPENLLRSEDGILGLVGRAGKGDTLLVQQLTERPHWGASTSNRADDPNLRLEAFIGAARRGATVRFLLDNFLDDSGSAVSNATTCNLVNELASNDQLRIECVQANPTGLGIHNKMILASIGGRGYIHIGSWNGTELSSKGNREVALLVQSDEAYEYLAAMFECDWPHKVYLSALMFRYGGFADHPLISEVVYDPYGADETEFIEIINPTLLTANLGNFSLGDAVSRDDFEDVRRFPENVTLGSGQLLVVATSAVDFFSAYHQWPDYELLDTTPLVDNMIDDPSWGDTAALLRLGNQGDEVILRNESDITVDVLTYGTGNYPGHVSCPLLTGTNHSLERHPYWHDSDNCPEDFRDWPFPSPGKTP